jgi:hypothetical protein
MHKHIIQKSPNRLRLCRPWCFAIAFPALVFLCGCGKSERTRYELSGTVTFGGHPVPAGYIVFTPSSAAGNAGPGAQADIHDGKFITQPGHGTVGGPHSVNVFGFDGKSYTPPGSNAPIVMGHPLFSPISIDIDLPKKAGVQDLVLPKK